MSTRDFMVESLARTAAAISTHGYAIQAVGSDCSVPGCNCPPSPRPWAYTIGLCGRGVPELLVIGLSDRQAQGVIAHVVETYFDSAELPVGRDQPLAFKGVPIRLLGAPLRSVAPDRDLLAGWYGYFSSFGPFTPPDVVQIVWADAVGRFPWQTLFDWRLRPRQPVLEMQPNAMLEPEQPMAWPTSSGRRRGRSR
ncbi:MAG: DUF4262 domain-containing protein [Ilumatobacteraceae bacterium]